MIAVNTCWVYQGGKRALDLAINVSGKIGIRTYHLKHVPLKNHHVVGADGNMLCWATLLSRQGLKFYKLSLHAEMEVFRLSGLMIIANILMPVTHLGPAERHQLGVWFLHILENEGQLQRNRFVWYNKMQHFQTCPCWRKGQAHQLKGCSAKFASTLHLRCNFRFCVLGLQHGAHDLARLHPHMPAKWCTHFHGLSFGCKH